MHNSDEDIFMIWRNRPTAVIGKNQNIYAEIDLDYAKTHDISVVRRITGGGAVYHDLGNVNYTFITSRDRAKALDFQYFSTPIIMALAELGIKAKLTGRNDLVAGGAKFSGNAQYADKSRILHHGTLLFSSDLSVMPHILKPDILKLKSKAIKSVRSRVINLSEILPVGLTVEGFMLSIMSYVQKKYNATFRTACLSEIAIGQEYERLTSEQWIYGRKRDYEYIKKAYLSAGLITVCFDITDNVMASTTIEGDFFGEADIRGLSGALNGCRYDRTSLLNRLDSIDIDKYINGATAEELADLIIQ